MEKERHDFFRGIFVAIPLAIVAWVLIALALVALYWLIVP